METTERRVFDRVAVTLTAHCRIGNRYVRDAVSDLSEGGLFLKTKEMAKEGTPVRVAIALPFVDGPRFCTLIGSVARIERDNRGALRGLGVSFLGEEIARTDREALHGYLRNGSPSSASSGH